MDELLPKLTGEGSFWWEIAHRPMVPASLALLSGAATSFHWAWFLVGIGCTLFGNQWSRRAIILLTFLLGLLIRPSTDVSLVHEKEEFAGSVTIKSMPQPIRTGYLATASTSAGNVLILLPEDSSYVPQDQLSVNGTLRPLREGFGFQSGARGVLLPERLSTVKNGWPGWRLGYSVRDSFAAAARAHLKESTADYVLAMCFNQTHGLDDSDWESFRQSGLTHIVSASGFHVVVTAGLLLALLSLVPIPRWMQLVFVAILLLLYASASGLRPPICRAVLMSYAALFAYFWRRQGDGLSALALASAINVLVNPAVIVDLGFHLSIAAVGGLVMFAPKLDQERTFISGLSVGAIGSLVAIIATLPVTLYVFGEFSLWAVLANVLILPLVSISVSASLLAWIIGAIHPGVGSFLWNALVTPATDLTIAGSGLGASLPGSMVQVPQFSFAIVWIAYLLLLMLWRPKPRES